MSTRGHQNDSEVRTIDNSKSRSIIYHNKRIKLQQKTCFYFQRKINRYFKRRA